MDADDSGELSLKEFSDIQVIVQGPGGASFEDRAKALLGLFDKDGDGKVTMAELKNVARKVRLYAHIYRHVHRHAFRRVDGQIYRQV